MAVEPRTTFFDGPSGNYEVGTFVPGFSGFSTPGSLGYSIQIGRYSKIGRLVAVEISLLVSAVNVAPAGSLLINGLPFTCNPDTGGVLAVSQVSLINTPSGYHSFGAGISRGSNVITLFTGGDNTALIAVQGSYIQVNSMFTLGGMFFTDA